MHQIKDMVGPNVSVLVVVEKKITAVLARYRTPDIHHLSN
jgi:hypothetical protein